RQQQVDGRGQEQPGEGGYGVVHQSPSSRPRATAEMVPSTTKYTPMSNTIGVDSVTSASHRWNDAHSPVRNGTPWASDSRPESAASTTPKPAMASGSTFSASRTVAGPAAMP